MYYRRYLRFIDGGILIMDKEHKKNVIDEEKLERIKVMREKLAKNMGTSNYLFYLQANINAKPTRGL